MDEVVTLTALVGDEAIHNGKDGIIKRLAYIHPDNQRITYNVFIPGVGLWAMEPWNIKKKTLEPYDGNKVISWDDPRCVWRPNSKYKNWDI
jgi:hypothetical protein